MADYNHESVWPFTAASALAAFVPVTLDTVNDQVVLADSTGDDVIGLTIATVATYGYSVAVVTDGKAKAVCGASVGAGARVAIASTNGALGPAAAAGGAGGASLGARYQVGLTLRAYAAGDIMTVLLDPGQIV